MIKDNRL